MIRQFIPTIHFFTDLTQITTTPIFILQGQSITIRDVTLTGIDYKLDNGQPLLIAVDFATSPPSGVAYIETVPEEVTAYWKHGVAEAGQSSRSDDYQEEPRIYLIEKIEVGQLTANPLTGESTTRPVALSTSRIFRWTCSAAPMPRPSQLWLRLSCLPSRC